jgi:hypothetical protein
VLSIGAKLLAISVVIAGWKDCLEKRMTKGTSMATKKGLLGHLDTVSHRK